jgi:hypothetical protein
MACKESAECGINKRETTILDVHSARIIYEVVWDNSMK